MKKILLLMTMIVPFIANSQTCFKDGMKWHICGYTFESGPNVKAYDIYVTAEKTDVDGVLMLYKSYDDSPEREFVGYVKTEEDRVLFNGVSSASADWYLLYDFGLKPGEGCYVYSLAFLDEQSVPRYKTYVECVALNEKSADYDGWDTLTMQEYDETVDPPDSSIKFAWIKGLGSQMGILHNGIYGTGGPGTKLTDVFWNGEQIFKRVTTGVSEIKDSGSADIRIDGRNLYVSAEKEMNCAIYTANGLHIGTYVLGSTVSRIELPDRGVYILKIGNESRKIVIR